MSQRMDRVKTLATRSRFRIGALLAQPDRLVITVDGVETVLEPRLMEVLVALAEHAGEVVSAEQLLIEVWRGTFYGDNPVHKAIALLRKLIGDDSRAPRYIETIRKRGYRLIAKVSFPDDYRRIAIQNQAWPDRSPFVGLNAFDSEHADVFCGRSRATADLLAAMRSQIDNQRRFVLIVGASGCGKTSLLRAGAIPLLQQEGGFDGLHALSVATCDLTAAESGNIMTQLASALGTWTLGERTVFAPSTAGSLALGSTQRTQAIIDVVTDAFRKYPSREVAEQPHAHLLLVIDHAETLVASTNIGHDERTRFSNAIDALCASPRTLVVMIARSDFYPKLIEAMPEIAERKAGDGHFDMLAPRIGEIAQIIRLPAMLAGLSFGEEPQSAARLDDVLRDSAAQHPDALPLLQHTLQSLYERRSETGELRFEAYREIGGLEGALAYRAEEVFAALHADGQSQLDAVLARLIVIQPDSDAVSARWILRESMPDVHAQTLIEAFVRARLFVGELRDGKPGFGVAHESLLRQWPRALEWAQDNRRLLQARARLQRAAARWVEEGRRDDHLLNPGRPLSEALEVVNIFPEDISGDERAFLHDSERILRRKRWARRIAVGTLAVLAAISLTLATLAFQARNDAEQRRREAQRLADFLLDDLAFELRSRGDLQLLDSIRTEALAYLQKRKIDELNPDEATNLSLALSLAGETAMNKGDAGVARTAFLRARDAAKATIASGRNSTKTILALGLAEYGLGKQQYDLENFESALQHWNEYLRISKRLTEIEPENPNWIAEFSQANGNLGALATRQGRHKDAIELLRRSVVMMDKAIAGNTRRDDWRYQKVVLQSWIARYQESIGELEEASGEYAGSIALLRRILANNPEAREWEQQLTSFLIIGANLETSRGHLDLANAMLQDCIARLTALTIKEPDYREWRYFLANAHTKASEAKRMLGDQDLSERHLRMASELMRRMAPLKRPELRLEATIRFLMGRNGISQNDRETMDLAIIDLEKIADAAPNSVDLKHSVATALISRGQYHLAAGNRYAAQADWEKALSILGEPAGASKDIRLLAPWVSAQLLLGNRERAKLNREHLSRIGYSHPDFLEILHDSR
jgi:eukaryotic-like serine/threonine-protein kinase